MRTFPRREEGNQVRRPEGGGESEAIEHILPPQPIYWKVEGGKWRVEKNILNDLLPSTLHIPDLGGLYGEEEGDFRAGHKP